ncbi:MAG TPA: glycine cleavage T C-terminal barrel domain-containing protein, partial [Bryobacteraceae bacterium]|nr:glycine cleavage T C-terminal barrel domain-containing protein [Bryobacteraceae bacterium]
ALHEGAAWIDLSGRGKIRATGDDRVRLLHSMTTNHIQNLLPGSGCYAFFLSAQGRILADANIFCMPDYLLIDTEPETRQRVIEHLDKFIIADDVTLHDFTDDYGTINIEGPEAEAILRRFDVPTAHLPFSFAEWSHCEVAHVTYTGQPGYSFIFPVEQRESVLAHLTGAGVPHADIATADVVRIENGRPRYGVDISEMTLPQETPLAHAVHSAKGCYIGQEIVERVRSRGHVNKMIAALDVQHDSPPAPGAKVNADGKEVGVVTSAAFSPSRNHVVALGTVRAEALNGKLTVDGASASVRRAVT